MKILILIGMIIVFISAFFIFFIFDTSIKCQILCFTDSNIECDSNDMGAFIIGLLMSAMFIIVDIITVYIIATTAMSDSETF